MSRKIEDLSQRFQPKAVALLKAIAQAGYHVLVVDTLRTPKEQAQNVARGVSWTLRSKHLTGDAIDIVLIDTSGKPRWNAPFGEWLQLGVIGESLGLTWGGRWKQRDLGHFELPTAHTGEGT